MTETTGVMTGATGVMTGATGVMTGKTVGVAGLDCSGNRSSTTSGPWPVILAAIARAARLGRVAAAP